MLYSGYPVSVEIKYTFHIIPTHVMVRLKSKKILMDCSQASTIEEYGVYTMLPAQQLAPISPWPPDGVLDRMDDLVHKGKGNGDHHFIYHQ